MFTITARKKVRPGEALFQAIVDRSGEGISLADSEGNYLFVNSAFCKKTGYSKAELDEMNIFDLLPAGADRSLFFKAAKGQSAACEVELLKKNGSRLWVEIKSSPVEMDDQRFVLEFVYDMTKAKRTEAAIRQSEDKFRHIFNNMRNGCAYCEMIFDKEKPVDFLYLDVNSAFERLTELKNVVGKKISEIIPGFAESSPEVLDIYGRVALGGEPETFELHVQPLFRWFSVSVYCPEKGYFMATFDAITARKKAEASLHESEEKYRVLFNTFPLGITISDRYGNIVETNEIAVNLLGVSKDEHQSRSLDGPQWRIIDSTGMPLKSDEWASVRALKENRLVENTEIGIVKPDGETTWLNVTAAPLPLENFGVVVTYGDITERKRAEREYQTLFREMLDGFALHQIIEDDTGRPVDYRFLAVNPAFEKITGLKAVEIVGRTVLEVLPGIEKNWIETYGAVALTGDPAFFESYSGTLGKHFQVTAFRPASGQFACIFVDITERKRTEEALKKSEERYRTILQTAMDGFWVVDTQGRLLSVNDAYCRMSGYGRKELFAMDVFDLEVIEKEEDINDHMRKITAQGEDRFETRHRRKDGTIFDVEVSVQYRSEDGGRFIAFIRDITEKKAKEEENIKLLGLLQQAQKLESIGNLAGGIAHDFNNILFPIVGISEMLMEDLIPGSQEHESIQQIYNAGKRGSELVKQILAFSRQAEPEMVAVSFQKILAEVIKLAHSTIPSNIRIEQDIQSDCGRVVADPTQLHQIAMNLITNAYHAVAPKSGEIIIALKETFWESDDFPENSLAPGRYAMLTVSDTGSGIAPDIFDKIFEPYFTTKEKGKGTGLGLAVVYGIVKEYGGDIRVHSEMGKGTTFNVYLPLAVGQTEQPPIIKTKMKTSGSEKILVVDDEEPIVRLEKIVLERLGYQVTTCSNSLNALNTFKADPDAYDLLITDMTMPGMTGDQLAKEIICIRPGIPVIICTGFSEQINREKADEIGIKGFLMKPVVNSEMAQMVRNVLDGATVGIQQ